MTEQKYSKIPILANFIIKDFKKATKKNSFFKKIQKAKKCNKCKYCLEKHLTKDFSYKLCLWRTAKLFTLNDTIKGCKYYKKKENKKNV